MENWLITIMNDYGYMGIIFLVAIENIFPPIPSEVILTFGGFMTTTSNLSVTGVALSATVGSVMGAIILYLIGLQLDIDRLEKIIDRWGHILRVKKKSIYKTNSWFERHGTWAVFLCRFVPVMRSLISVPAGMSKMMLGLFLLLTTVGTFIWNLVLVLLGASLGNSWETIVEYLDIYSEGLFAVFFLFIIYRYVKRRKRRKIR